MEYLCSRNFIHRDLATRNVLVAPRDRRPPTAAGGGGVYDEDGRLILNVNQLEIKIADFGMARNTHADAYYVNIYKIMHI